MRHVRHCPVQHHPLSTVNNKQQHRWHLPASIQCSSRLFMPTKVPSRLSEDKSSNWDTMSIKWEHRSIVESARARLILIRRSQRSCRMWPILCSYRLPLHRWTKASLPVILQLRRTRPVDHQFLIIITTIIILIRHPNRAAPLFVLSSRDSLSVFCFACTFSPMLRISCAMTLVLTSPSLLQSCTYFLIEEEIQELLIVLTSNLDLTTPFETIVKQWRSIWSEISNSLCRCFLMKKSCLD